MAFADWTAFVETARATALRSGSPLRRSRKLWRQVRGAREHLERRFAASAAARDLTPPLRAHVDALRAVGFSRAGDELDAGALVAIADLAARRIEGLDTTRATPGELKTFWKKLREPGDLVDDGPLVRFALQENVLRIAAAFFGEAPYLADVQLILSHDTGAPGWQESQLWHRDYADTKTVKLFAYLTDVTGDADGPFTYLPRSISRRVKNAFFPGRIDDAAMDAQVGMDRAVKVLGPRASAFYVDTANCYHQGSRVAPGHHRLAYVATYITHASLDRYEHGIRITRPHEGLPRLALRA